jgi:uncharacterized protein YjbI with pentapeptide repeats
MSDTSGSQRSSGWKQAFAYARGTISRLARHMRPSFRFSAQLDDDEWRRQHDEVSKTIWIMSQLFVGTCVFCLLTLDAPDATLVTNDARVTIPVTGTPVSYSAFLFFGPIVLTGLTIYLHVLIDYRLRLGAARTKMASPYIFNFKGLPAVLLSAFLYYAILPLVMAVFAWKALPRPDAPLFVCFTLLVTAVMLYVAIKRYGAGETTLSICGRIALAVLWICLTAAIVSGVLMAPRAYRTARTLVIERVQGPPETCTSASALPETFPLSRRLNLYGATFEKKSLRGLYFANADMRKTNLRDTDLEWADLRDADLRRADLSGADLYCADLHGTKIDELTVVSEKWRIAICAFQGNLQSWRRGTPGPCLASAQTPWSDLSGVDLDKSDLSSVDLTGADLSGADLSAVTLSSSTNLRLTYADEKTKLPTALKDANTDGSSRQESWAMLSFKNRETQECLKAGSEPENGLPVFVNRKTCFPNQNASARDTGVEDGADEREYWELKRMSREYVRIRTTTNREMCLDSSFGIPLLNDKKEAAQPNVQVWACGDDFANQWWHVRREEQGYIVLEIEHRNKCLTSPLDWKKEIPAGLLTLDPCDGRRTQEWSIISAQRQSGEAK